MFGLLQRLANCGMRRSFGPIDFFDGPYAACNCRLGGK